MKKLFLLSFAFFMSATAFAKSEKFDTEVFCMSKERSRTHVFTIDVRRNVANNAYSLQSQNHCMVCAQHPVELPKTGVALPIPKPWLSVYKSENSEGITYHSAVSSEFSLTLEMADLYPQQPVQGIQGWFTAGDTTEAKSLSCTYNPPIFGSPL